MEQHREIITANPPRKNYVHIIATIYTKFNTIFGFIWAQLMVLLWKIKKLNIKWWKTKHLRANIYLFRVFLACHHTCLCSLFLSLSPDLVSVWVIFSSFSLFIFPFAFWVLVYFGWLVAYLLARFGLSLLPVCRRSSSSSSSFSSHYFFIFYFPFPFIVLVFVGCRCRRCLYNVPFLYHSSGGVVVAAVSAIVANLGIPS